MPERICAIAHEYAGRQVKVGDRFEVEPGDVELMLATGRVQRESDDRVPGYVSRDMAANWPHGYQTAAMTARGKRTTLRKVA